MNSIWLIVPSAIILWAASQISTAVSASDRYISYLQLILALFHVRIEAQIPSDRIGVQDHNKCSQAGLGWKNSWSAGFYKAPMCCQVHTHVGGSPKPLSLSIAPAYMLRGVQHMNPKQTPFYRQMSLEHGAGQSYLERAPVSGRIFKHASLG